MPCLLLFCPGTFHSVAAHHVRAVGESTMLTFGMFVSLRMFWCNCLSHFTFNWPSFHRWPVIQNTREILSLLDLREVDEKRHDAGKCHICVTGWKPAARIHYSVPNRPPDITLSWTLLKRSAIHGFPTAGGKICCHNPGARERNAHPWVPTQPVEMFIWQETCPLFSSWRILCCEPVSVSITIRESWLQALKISWSPTLLGSLCQWTIWKHAGSFLPNILVLLKC